MKKHISNSQLETYWRCPEQYRRRYIEGEKVAPGVALLVGSGVHVGAETNFKQKIESHRDLSADDIIDAAVAGFDQRVTVDGYTLSSDEQSQGARQAIGAARDVVVTLAALHAAEQAPAYQPTEVEKATTIVLDNCSRDLVAITDLRDDKKRVCDFKTAARKPSDDEAHKSLQLTIVAAAYQVDHGEPCSDVRLDVLTKTKDPKRYVLQSQRDERDFASLAARIETTVSAIDAGIFPPTSPGNWACSERWCGFARTCPFYSRRTS